MLIEKLPIEGTGLPKGSFQKLRSGFCPLRGVPTPPPTPLTENHFSKKPLTENPLSFSGNFFPKRAKNDVFSLNKVKNGPKRPYNGPKRAKNA